MYLLTRRSTQVLTIWIKKLCKNVPINQEINKSTENLYVVYVKEEMFPYNEYKLCYIVSLLYGDHICNGKVDIRGVTNLEGDNLVVFYFLSESKIWLDKSYVRVVL